MYTGVKFNTETALHGVDLTFLCLCQLLVFGGILFLGCPCSWGQRWTDQMLR